MGKGESRVGVLVVGSGSDKYEQSSQAHNLLEVCSRQVTLGL